MGGRALGQDIVTSPNVAPERDEDRWPRDWQVRSHIEIKLNLSRAIYTICYTCKLYVGAFS